MIKSEMKTKSIDSKYTEMSSHTDWHYKYVEKTSEDWPSWKKEVYEKNYIKAYQCPKGQKV